MFEMSKRLCPNCDEALLDASTDSHTSDPEHRDDLRQHHRENEHALLTTVAETAVVSSVISHVSEGLQGALSEESDTAEIVLVIDAQEGSPDSVSDNESEEVIEGEQVITVVTVDDGDISFEESGDTMVPGDEIYDIVASGDEEQLCSEEAADVTLSDDC